MLGNLAALDVGIILAYMLGCLLVAFWKSTEIKTIRDYTLGDGSVSTVVLICTIFGTYLNASSTIGTVEMVYTMGLFFVVAKICSVLVWPITARIYVNVEQFQGCLSISDIMYVLYGSFGRWITTIASVILSVGIIAAQAIAIGYMFDYFLEIGQFAGILVGMGVLTVYSAFGGIRAIAMTHVLQFVVFYVAIPTACFFALKDVGGMESLYQKLPESHVTFNLEGEKWLYFLSVSILLLPLNSPPFIQRFLMSNNTRQLSKALHIIGFLHLPLLLTICMIGFIIRVQMPEVQSNVAFMVFMDKYLCTGIKGLMIVGMIAVMMSTADSFLNTASILCAHNVGKGLYPGMNDEHQLSLARFSACVIAGMAIVIATSRSGIVELLWWIRNFWEPIILVPMIAGFLSFRTHPNSFRVSCCTAIMFVYVGSYIDGKLATVSIVLGIVGSAIGFFGAHYLQLWFGVEMPKLDEKLLKKSKQNVFKYDIC
ncbi:sodium:solute symporter family protein [Rickettsiales endosymbiont of Peranema trichophorum]|uniref:sodium:solute symporter family protein n=1 Tax=Rickettsiales endosymbiont of Peranema trichophorum TaxID=2486577 RepID=UPI001022B190|nr:sodium:solute symporter family protein [Rickettsiales endosymbiont of Peranema trichophorum]RZI45975.1 sodium:solute symporter family protein [Rickettsiales endosymbiont of Peranema trichophorum]